MLSGFPFRMVNELQGAYSASQTCGGHDEHPASAKPGLPMAADPRLDMTPYLYRTLEALQREMSYAGRYRQLDPTDEPAQPAVAPSNYVAAPAQAQAQAPAQYQVGCSSPSSLGSSLQLPIDPVSILPIPTGGPAGQPLEQVFSKVVDVLRAPVQSPFQGNLSSSLFNNPAIRGFVADGSPQDAQPVRHGRPPGLLAQLFPSLLPTSQAAPTSDVSLDEQIADYYDMSPQTREVLNHYGTEAPAILNEYALGLSKCSTAVAWGEKAQATIKNYADFAAQSIRRISPITRSLLTLTFSDYTPKFLVPKVPTLFTRSRSWKPPVTRLPRPVTPWHSCQNFPAPPRLLPWSNPAMSGVIQ